MARSWIEISLGRIIHNLDFIRGKMPVNVPVIAVVKADAYGHGAIPVTRALHQSGVETFAVASLDEALELREILPLSTEILVFGGVEEGRENLYRESNITASHFDELPLPEGVKVHLKVDTGMGRLGIRWDRLPGDFVKENGNVTGVYSHFSSADSSPEYTRRQLERFNNATGSFPVRRHISNSAGLRFPEANLDAVRPGLALYGIAPCPELDGLKPALRWKARILAVKDLPKGSPVGYSRTFTTTRPSRIGILPVGYADGYNRLLSGKGSVRLGTGDCVPVLGIVSMDLVSIDLTGYPGVKKGDEVLLLEADPKSPLSADAIADQTGTIAYEVLTSIGNRVEHCYLDF